MQTCKPMEHNFICAEKTPLYHPGGEPQVPFEQPRIFKLFCSKCGTVKNL